MCFTRKKTQSPSPPPGGAQRDFDLKPTIKIFEDYVQAARKANASTIHFELAVEAVERLRQLDLLLTRIVSIQRHVSTGQTLLVRDFLLPVEGTDGNSKTADEGQVIAGAFFHARLYTETFYYLAFRFRQILTTQNKVTGNYPLPDLRNFEAAGIRDVRNHLLEHPEGRTSQVFSQDHSLGGSDGPKLKIDATGAAHVDSGLFVNAAEFKQCLEAVLTRALAQLKTTHP